MKAGVNIYINGSSNKEGKKVLKASLDELDKYIMPMMKLYKESELTYEDWYKTTNMTEWATAFIMKFNAKHFEFLPILPLKSNKIELFEIKELGDKLFYQIAKIHAFDDLFNPLQVKSLKDFGYKGGIYEIIDNMVSGKYQVWSEVIDEI